MGATVVTGATGFVGSAVVRHLLRRGDDVRAAVRDPDRAAGLGCDAVRCDVLDRRSVRRALDGAERVFHVAGLTSLRAADRERCFEVNVKGTRIVLEECLRAGVERVVHTSGAGAVGPAPARKAADESQLFTAGRLGIAQANSKHEAEAEAMRLAAHGLPVVCVNPTWVFGAGARPSSSAGIVRRFLLGQIPLYVPGGLNVVDVEDVARGHLLADSNGVVGERYLLGGARNFTWDRLFADLSRLSGVRPPPLRLPAGPTVRALEALEAAGGPLPVSVDAVKVAAQWWTYKTTKARRDLGWSSRPHEEALEATVEWWLETDGEAIEAARRAGLRRRAADRALASVGSAIRTAGRMRAAVA